MDTHFQLFTFYDRKYFIKDNIRLNIDSKLSFSNIENTNSYNLLINIL